MVEGQQPGLGEQAPLLHWVLGLLRALQRELGRALEFALAAEHVRKRRQGHCIVGVAVERPQVQGLGGSRIFGRKNLRHHQRALHVFQLVEQQAGPLHAQPARQLGVALALRAHLEQVAQQSPLFGLAIDLFQLGECVAVRGIAGGQGLQHLDQRLPLIGGAVELFELGEDGPIRGVACECLAQDIGQLLDLPGPAIEFLQFGKGRRIRRIARQLLFQERRKGRPLFGLAIEFLQLGEGRVVVGIARQHLFVERPQRGPAFGLAVEVLQLGQCLGVLRIAVQHLAEGRDGLVDPGGVPGAHARHAERDLGGICGVGPLVFELGDLLGEVVPLACLLGQALGFGEQIRVVGPQPQCRHHYGIGSISGIQLLFQQQSHLAQGRRL